MSNPTLVLFAIQSAVRLGRQARAAYVDSTKRRELVLPLPNFNPSQELNAAVTYFLGRDADIKGPKSLRDLIDKLRTLEQTDAPLGSLTKDEVTDLVAFHNEQLLLDFRRRGMQSPSLDDLMLTNEALEALVTIRQWRRGSDPNPSVLQRLAGTFVEIGVDYYTTVPGSVNPQSSKGRALLALFESLDGIDFAVEHLGTLPTRLLIATLEGISGVAELASNDPKIQELITVTSDALARDVAERIKEIRAGTAGDLDREERVSQWAELTFRSVLGNAGSLVAQDPERFLGVKDAGKAALVGDVSTAVLALVLDQPEGELDKVFSRGSLDGVVKAALGAVAKHPELVGAKRNGIKVLVTEVARQLTSVDNLIDQAVIPEIARMVIERTAFNLPLFWPDAENHPEKNLLLVAAQETLLVLSKKPAEGDRWKPAFGRQDLVGVADTLLDEVANNPGWIVSGAGEVDVHLGAAVEAMLRALRKRGDESLSTEVAGEILQAGLKAAALRAEFLEELPNGHNIASATLDAVLGRVFDPDLDRAARWRLLRHETLVGLVERSLDQLARAELKPAAIEVLDVALGEQVNAIKDGQPWDLERFEQDLGKALAAAI